mgnify:CR=1 FL=1
MTFELDWAGREVMSWQATTGGQTGDLVREVMLAAVEQRFGTDVPATPIQWLTDNGSPYIARATQAFARDLGLEPLTTPVCSPQSNGMAESLVRTIKRDDVAFMPKPEPAKAMRNLALAFGHYNEHHPHSALKYRSPCEYRRRQASSNQAWVGVREYGEHSTGWLMERSLCATLTIMPALVDVAALSMIYLPVHATGLMMLVALWGLAFGGVPVAWSNWVAHAVPDQAETAGGMVVASVQPSIAAGAALGGVVFGLGGVTGVFITAGVVMLLAAVFIGFRVRVALSQHGASASQVMHI